MKTPGTGVGTVEEGAFVITTMPGKASLDGKFIAVVRPPAIDAEREDFAMPRPVIADVEGRGEVFEN